MSLKYESIAITLYATPVLLLRLNQGAVAKTAPDIDTRIWRIEK